MFLLLSSCDLAADGPFHQCLVKYIHPVIVILFCMQMHVLQGVGCPVFHDK